MTLPPAARDLPFFFLKPSAVDPVNARRSQYNFRSLLCEKLRGAYQCRAWASGDATTWW